MRQLNWWRVAPGLLTSVSSRCGPGLARLRACWEVWLLCREQPGNNKVPCSKLPGEEAPAVSGQQPLRTCQQPRTIKPWRERKLEDQTWRNIHACGHWQEAWLPEILQQMKRKQRTLESEKNRSRSITGASLQVPQSRQQPCPRSRARSSTG